MQQLGIDRSTKYTDINYIMKISILLSTSTKTLNKSRADSL